MAPSESRDPFNELKKFLIEAVKLEEKDAAIYILGLRKGIITSGDVIDAHIVPRARQNTAGDHLRRLRHDGYFESGPEEENRRGKGRARKYKATPPEIVLKEPLELYKGLNQILGEIDEHREVLSETSELDEDIWILKSQKIGMQQFASMIRGARKSIKIYSHDCTWFEEPSVSNALRNAKQNKVGIQVFATNPDERIVKGLKKIGDIARTKTRFVPFCIVDDSILLLPCKGGVFANEYFVVSTRQKYLVDNFVETFNSLQKSEI